MNMLKWSFLLTLLFILTFFAQLGISKSSAEKVCKGWDCAEVTCPNGYAVLVPGKGYLPCEKFDDYINNGNDEVLIK